MTKPNNDNDTEPNVADHLIRNQCPDCKNWGFIDGPRGGKARNIFCANPECRAAFNAAWYGTTVIMWQRIPKAPPQYYPPQVHLMAQGLPLCCFTIERDVTRWPRGHWYVMHGSPVITNPEEVTCPSCKALIPARVP